MVLSASQGSRGLEAALAGVAAGVLDRRHHVVDVLLGVGCGLGEVIAVPDEAGIQAELCGSLRLLGVVDDQELVGAVLAASSTQSGLRAYSMNRCAALG